MDRLYLINQWMFGAVLFVVLLVIAEVNFRFGASRIKKTSAEDSNVLDTFQTPVLALMGLLLAFSYSIALSRYEQRKELVVVDANSLGTTYLRAGLLQDPFRQTAQALIRECIDLRLKANEGSNDTAQVQQTLAQIDAVNARLWSVAESAARSSQGSAVLMTSLFIQSLNQTIDLMTTRVAARRYVVPHTVLDVLIMFSLVSMGIFGYRAGLSGQRHGALVLLLAMLVSIVMIVIVDLDNPRQGLIQISQQPILDLQQNISKSH